MGFLRAFGHNSSPAGSSSNTLASSKTCFCETSGPPRTNLAKISVTYMVYGWLSRPYADRPDRYLESPPQTSLLWTPTINVKLRANQILTLSETQHHFPEAAFCQPKTVRYTPS
jgi:hypothetical protein